MRCTMGRQETGKGLVYFTLGVSQDSFHRAPFALMRKTEEIMVCSILEAKQIKQEYIWVYVCVYACVYLCIPIRIICICVHM